MRFHQRGDGDGGMLIIAITLLVFLFWGSPDPWDALHAKVMSWMPPAAQAEEPKKPEAKKGLAF